jgi:hypothetical protein
VRALESFGIVSRLLGVTCDNASNNETFMQELMTANCPGSGFSNSWNRVLQY